MSGNRLLDTAHQILTAHIEDGDHVIDATLGNGHDCVFLAKRVGRSGHVYGFDIQARAIENSHQRLTEHGLIDRVSLFLNSHANLLEFVEAPVQAIVFNLGYLPGGDKSLITQSESTLAALNAACKLLSANGIISLLVYPGHTGGEQESTDLDHWLRQLDPQHWCYDIHYSQHHHPAAPRLIILKKQPICYDARPINPSFEITMSEFNNVTIVKKANVYFDGNVSSRTIIFADGSKKTLGFMLPGEYTFNTGAPEIMEILGGELEVLLPESDWQTIKGGESFNVPGNASFTMRVSVASDYCCSFLS